MSMTAWETEDEYAAAAQASLPTPTNTPYRTPSNKSRRSSRKKSLSPVPSSSPAPGDRRIGKDVSNDDSISILDPRRFTPTLHANLVSEILALRRDQEEKTKTIESLESALHETRGENEELEASLGLTSKESRSLKRQLALLEGGTSSALSELARERDEAVESSSEVKKRLEVAQKKLRSQEENSDRVHDLWAKDKDNWDEEKRKLERRVHAADSRLKKLLEEFAAYEASQQHTQTPESEVDEPTRNGHGHGSDTASVRTMSMTNSIRFSMLSGPNGYGAAKTNGVSLADELDLSEGEETTDHDGHESRASVRHMRNPSRDSVRSRHHRSNHSIDSLMRPGSAARGRALAHKAVLEDGILEDDESVPVKVEYTDTGVQFSPPPSPKLAAIEAVPLAEPIPTNALVTKVEKQEQPQREWEVEANQRRKRVHVNPPLIIEPSRPMVSAASQTLEDPLSPPRTPISPTRVPPPPPHAPTSDRAREMISHSTQTDEPRPQSPTRVPPLPPIPIPSIQLHPPQSRPATPHEPLLPQHSKDASCQVSMRDPVPSRSVSVQTEEIRVDKRINLLPPHLQPSSISSTPPSPEPNWEETKRFSPIPGNLPPKNPKRMKSFRSSLEQDIPSSPPPVAGETRDAYPGNNDDGPLSKERGSIRRPHRISSLFAGFDNASSDEADDFADGDMSDNDYRTALSAPKPAGVQRGSRRISGPTAIQEHVELSEVSRPLPPRKSSLKQLDIYNMYGGEYGTAEVESTPPRSSLISPTRQLDKPLSLVTNTSEKPNPMRRAAMIQSGVAAHQGRSRSPSLLESGTQPPFPIPTRASSRRPPISTSAPSDGNRSPTWGRGYRMHQRSGSIRKVRSAAALPRGGRAYRRQGSRSPPPMSPSTEAPESPQLPPMPNNGITTPRYMKDTASHRYRTHTRQAPSANTANTTNTGSGSIGSSSQATGVVDAIAQTMVGEWMFKYVRRRKSFGVGDMTGVDENAANGVRHKRWVWLAPYERAVMWSSKQPTSGSALMGKTGRKLTIQSVLDVKDDNPAPKGSPIGGVFNRSILILTPARALKFTATSSERHYVWLTALSFLAHSSQAVPDIPHLPLPQTDYHTPIPNFELPAINKAKRQGIRDSIRVTKGKTAAARSGPTSIHSSIQENTESLYSRPATIPDTAADAPIVPRFTGAQYSALPNTSLTASGPPAASLHNRKRSNTGPRPAPPLSFRGFSSASQGHAPTNSTAGMSVGSSLGSSDLHAHTSLHSGPSSAYGGGPMSARTSEASSARVLGNNFFDAVGTVRMEAFISPLSGFGGVGGGGFEDLEEEREMERREREREGAFMGGGGGGGRRDGRIGGGGGGGGGSSSRQGRSRNQGHVRGGSREEWRGGREREGGGGGHRTTGEEEWGSRGGGEYEGGGGGGHDPFRGF